MHNFTEFKAFLSTPRHIFITTHYKPDADALGSALGWAGYLKACGHHVSVVTPSDYPRFLNWMSGNEDVIIFSEKTKKQIENLLNQAELVCCLDFSGMGRINNLAELLIKADKPILLVDHHIEPTIKPLFDFWDVHAAATAELIFKLILLLDGKNKITKDIGEAIYAGIMTDTASFKHPSTTKYVHEVAGQLIDLGVNTSKVNHLVYDDSTEERLRFLGYMLSKKLVVLPEFRTAYFTVTDAELKQFHSQTGDTEGIVNYALSIEGIVFAAIIIDRGDTVKMSFRSVGDFPANLFSKNNFNGGGHKNAAGGHSFDSFDKTLKKFLDLLPSYQKELAETVF